MDEQGMTYDEVVRKAEQIWDYSRNVDSRLKTVALAQDYADSKAREARLEVVRGVREKFDMKRYHDTCDTEMMRVLDAIERENRPGGEEIHTNIQDRVYIQPSPIDDPGSLL